jgi:hypothetical protein
MRCLSIGPPVLGVIQGVNNSHLFPTPHLFDLFRWSIFRTLAAYHRMIHTIQSHFRALSICLWLSNPKDELHIATVFIR